MGCRRPAWRGSETTYPTDTSITVQVDGSKPQSQSQPGCRKDLTSRLYSLWSSLTSHTKPVANELYADDTLLHQLHPRCEEFSLMPLQSAVEAAENWALSWHGRFGSAKTKMMTSLQNISPEHKTIHIENDRGDKNRKQPQAYLGLYLTADLDWHDRPYQPASSKCFAACRTSALDVQRPNTINSSAVVRLLPSTET